MNSEDSTPNSTWRNIFYKSLLTLLQRQRWKLVSVVFDWRVLTSRLLLTRVQRHNNDLPSNSCSRARLLPPLWRHSRGVTRYYVSSRLALTGRQCQGRYAPCCNRRCTAACLHVHYRPSGNRRGGRSGNQGPWSWGGSRDNLGKLEHHVGYCTTQSRRIAPEYDVLSLGHVRGVNVRIRKSNYAKWCEWIEVFSNNISINNEFIHSF